MSSASHQPVTSDGRSKTAGSTPARAGPNPVESNIHLLDRVVVMYRYRAIAISVFILTTLAVIIQSSTAVPIYRAHARILIEGERSTAIAGLNAVTRAVLRRPRAVLQHTVQDSPGA